MGGFIYMVTCKRRPSSLLHYRKTNLPFFEEPSFSVLGFVQRKGDREKKGVYRLGFLQEQKERD